MSTETSSAPALMTSSIRSEKYDDQDESRLPIKTSSARWSARRIWQSMSRPSMRRLRCENNQVGRFDPFGRNRDPEPPRVVQVNRASDLGCGVERDSRRVLATDQIG